MTEGIDPFLIFAVIRITISLFAALFALSVYRFYKGGLTASAWPIFIIGALLQAVAGFGEIIDQVLRNEVVGAAVDTLAEILSLLAFLWFAIRVRNSWEQLKRI